ncbi:MAG: hypothetical protein JNG89_05625, partial [Planctomycetaceae bacterium]|nr:hypothetical protein [Planctomycetaceae bacterium]
MRTVSHFGRYLTCCLCLLAVLAGHRSAAAGDTEFVFRTHVDEQGPHHYAVYVPRSYTRESRWPVVLYLHGAGLSGTDGRRHLHGGLAAVIRSEGDYPAIVVFPQCENVDATLLSRWLADSPDGQRAIRILDDVEREYSVDPSRRVLAGWSMGGYGAWSLAAAHPDRWSAVVPVSGGGRPELAAHITAPVWAIHGAGDRAIPPSQ